MVRLKKLLRQTEFQVLLFCIYLVLICLPFIVYQDGRRFVNMYAFDMFEYFFLVWGIVIAILMLVSRSIGTAPGPDDTGDEGGR